MLNISELLNTINREQQIANAQREQKQTERLERIKNSLQFKITITRKGVVGLEEFSIEGYEEAMSVLDLYRKSGNMLGLKTITVYTNDEKVNRIKWN